MKKQKKLNLGKIKIAGVSNVYSLMGGATTNCQSATDQPAENTCACPQETDACDSTPAKTCSGNTRAGTDHCTDTNNNNTTGPDL